MLSGNMAYDGDAALGALLKGAGSALSVAATRRLIGGVLAAPPGYDRGAWMSLVAPAKRLDRRLRQQLAALAGKMAAAPGGSGEPPPRQRLRLFRAELKRRRLHGFVVPRTDEHQGEYVPRRAERLAWLTGFTGSAGAAVVLGAKAAVFVDGRYTLQVRSEVDGALFKVRHLSDDPATDWIAANLPSKARLGHDPWLHTARQVAALETACAKAGGRLFAVKTNPVDAVWAGQLPPPLAPVVVQSARYAGRTSLAKRREVARAVVRGEADAVVLTAPDSIAWLLNVRGGDVPFTPLVLAFAVLHADASLDLFVDPRKMTPPVARHLGAAVRIHAIGDFGKGLDALGGPGGGHKSRRVRVDAAGAPSWVHRRLAKAGAPVVHGADPCQLAKALKNPVELEGIRAAHRRDGAALTSFLAWLAAEAPGGRLTEMAAANHLEKLRAADPLFRGLSFPTISGAGPNGAIVHYRVTEASDRRLKAGSLYLVDSGAQYLDGTTDVTRTLAIGKPSAEMRDRFTRVLKGHIAVAMARLPDGTTGSQVDTLARRALWDAGLDYDHGTGHGVGAYLGVHEGPQRISRQPSEVALQAGMVVSNEPGYYKSGAFGIRIENLVAVVPLAPPPGAERPLLGFETLTLAPIDRGLVAPALLEDGEVAWLDAYHARVLRELTPLVDAATGRWLKGATRPLR